MAYLRNNHTGDLILPDGTGIRVGRPAVHIDDHAWAETARHPVVAAWVDKGWIIVEADAAPKPGFPIAPPVAETAPVAPAEPEVAPVPTPEPLIAVHKGGGKWVIKQGNAIIYDKGLTKADAQAFNELSDEDKRAFIEG